MVSSLQFLLPFTSQKSQMTVKIEKVSDGRKTVVRLSGRLRSEHLDELKTQIDGDQSRIALDLDGVTDAWLGGLKVEKVAGGRARLLDPASFAALVEGHPYCACCLGN